jgi:general stress protein 26
MPRVASFAEIEQDFLAVAGRIVWATVTTVDAEGRPFSRVLHPIWEGSTGWIATGRQTLKTRHLTANPAVAVAYWDQSHVSIMAQCRAEWCDDAPTKRHVWDLFKHTPPPLGYDPGLFFPGGVDDAGFGVLKLTPSRIDLWSLAELMERKSPRRWIAP